jgi:heptosyltransferase-3
MQRFLAVHRGSLGDFLLFLPSLTLLRQTFPEARIEILGRMDILSLVCPGIADSIASVERATFVPFFENSAGLPDEEARYLASFDAALAFLSDPEKVFESTLVRLGIGDVIVRPPFPPVGKRIHVSEYLFDAVAPLLRQQRRSLNSISAELPPRLLQFEESEVRQAEAFLEATRTAAPPIVAMHPGSGSRKKCWPPEKFEALARELRRDAGLTIMIILGPADERLVKRMTTLQKEVGGIIARNLPLRHLAAALAQCDVYVGNDSGITHLAAAAGVPAVAIFGPTDPAIWAPAGKRVRVVKSDTGCSPCTRDEMKKCDNSVCLDGVAVADVAAAVREMLA